MLLFIGYKQWRWGGWKVILLDSKGDELVERKVSIKKAEEILNDESELSVYLKGICSPYRFLKIDLITKGKELGILDVDRKKQLISINQSNYKEESQNGNVKPT